MLRLFVLCLFIAGCSSSSVPRNDDLSDAESTDATEEPSSETVSETVSETEDSDTPVDSETSDSFSDTYTKNWSCLICTPDYNVR